MGFLGAPLGIVMKFFYDFIQNYGLTLIVFTVLIKLVLFPLSIKQQKNQAKMAIFTPKIKELQKKYANNKQKLQEEQMKLYEKEGYNPMSSCLPMVLQMVVLFGIIEVVYRPLKYILSIPADVISQATKALTELGVKVSSPELMIVNIIQGHDSTVSANSFNSIFSSDVLAKIKEFDLSFLGINLGQVPKFALTLIVLIPIISGVTSLIYSLYNMRIQKRNGMAQQQGMGMMNGMMLIMPIFSTFIAFTLPAGVGLYWIISNLTMMLQTLVLNKMYDPIKMKDKLEAEMAEQKASKKKSQYQKMLAKANDGSGKTIVVDNPDLTENQKIALARKRMAEKYGDESE